MIKRVPWFRRLTKKEIEPPVRLPMAVGPVSNGEAWWPDSPRKKLIRKLVLDKAEEISRKEGVDRREFLASSCGMATTLYMINLVNGCTGEKSGPKSSSSASRGSTESSSNGGSRGSEMGSMGMASESAGSSGGSSGGMSSGGTSGGGSMGMMRNGGMSGGNRGGMRSGGTSGGSMGRDGGFNIPPDAMVDPEIAEACLGGDELIIDMQTHFTTPEADADVNRVVQGFFPSINEGNFPWIQRRSDGMHQTNRDAYVELIMDGSDTTVGVLSGIAYSLGPDGMGGRAVLTNEALIRGVEYLESVYPGRMLSHAMVMPNDRIDIQLATMDRTASSYTHWKTYTPWGPRNGALPQGYWLDGMDDPNMVGPKMIERGVDLGAPIFCCHKGFPLTSFSPTYTNPRDVGPAANMFPDAHFVIYHSGFEHGQAAGQNSRPTERAAAETYCNMAIQRAGGRWPEGPYNEQDATVQESYPLDRGLNSLISSLRAANIGPNGTKLDPGTKEIIAGTEDSTHVWGELGGVVPNLMTGRIEEAMHFFGKLLLHIGEDRIVWGTDCLWFGSPQPIIEAFRCFEISEEYQERFGYPALTQERKAKIFGQNSARLQMARGIDHLLGKCHADIVGETAMRRRRDLDGEWGPRRDMVAPVPGPRTRRQFLALHAHEEREKHFWSGRVPYRT